MHVLRTDLDVLSSAKRFRDLCNCGEGWNDHDFDIGDIAQVETERLDESRRLRLSHVHLPIGCDDFFAHYFLSVNAATPGNSLPSSNSSEAPPPVEMNVILSASPACFTAVTESPPPMMVVAPIWRAPSPLQSFRPRNRESQKFPPARSHKTVST